MRSYTATIDGKEVNVRELPAGRAMNIMIAKHVMEWRVEKAGAHDGDHAWLNDPANYPHVTDYVDAYPLILWREPDTDGVIWSPSTDVAAAWSLIEAMHKKWGGKLRTLVQKDFRGYSCEMVALTGHGAIARITEVETMPLAVCRAALVAVL